MREVVLQWVDGHEVFLGWLFVASAVMFFGTLAAVPFLVVRIPADYFADREKHRSRWSQLHPAMRLVLLILKNLLGVVLILCAIPLLVGPGQGLLTLAIGVLLLDFPGKYKFERCLISRPSILGAINWIRRRRGVEPLRIDNDSEDAGDDPQD